MRLTNELIFGTLRVHKFSCCGLCESLGYDSRGLSSRFRSWAFSMSSLISYFTTEFYITVRVVGHAGHMAVPKLRHMLPWLAGLTPNSGWYIELCS